MISMIGTGISVGTIIGLLSNVGFEKFDEGWRVSCSIVALGELIFAIGFIFLPYTPRYSVFSKKYNLQAINYVQDLFNVFITHHVGG